MKNAQGARGELARATSPPHISAGAGAGSELGMILVELMFAIMVAAVALVAIPLILLMAGVASVVLLWVFAPTALLVAVVLWLLFPHTMGVAVLLFALLALALLTRRRPVPMNHRYRY
jgi:hypothetical protein